MSSHYLDMEDGDLERESAHGDKEAFAQLYDRHFDRVFDHLRSIVRDEGDAEDLAQETFLRAMRALSSRSKEKPVEAAFSTYLFTIARNLAITFLARKGRATAHSEVGQSPTFYEVDAKRFANPEDAAAANEAASLVWDAAAALGPQDYSLLDLHLRQGLDSAEIANVLGISKGSAYTKMSRLRDAFESAVSALLMVRSASGECAELARIIADQTAIMTLDLRRRVDRHVASCETCDRSRRRLVSPAALFGAMVAAPISPGVKQRVADAWKQSWGKLPAQGMPPGGPTGHALPIASKFAGLPGGIVTAVIGGAMLALVGTGGGVLLLSGSDGGGGGGSVISEASPTVDGGRPTNITPAPSAIETPPQSGQAAAGSVDGLTVRRASIFNDFSPIELIVMGEVVNNNPFDVDFVYIEGRLLDSSGAVVKTLTAPYESCVEVIPANGVSPFSFKVVGLPPNTPQLVAGYDLAATGHRSTYGASTDLEISVGDATTRPSDAANFYPHLQLETFSVDGTVSNESGETLYLVGVCLAVYDSAGNVICARDVSIEGDPAADLEGTRSMKAGSSEMFTASCDFDTSRHEAANYKLWPTDSAIIREGRNNE